MKTSFFCHSLGGTMIYRKEQRLWILTAQILVLPLTSTVTLGKSPTLSKAQFPYPQNENNTTNNDIVKSISSEARLPRFEA